MTSGTPNGVLDRLNVASVAALRTESLKQALERDGLNAVGNSRAEARAYWRSEFTKWDRIIKEKYLTAD